MDLRSQGRRTRAAALLLAVGALAATWGGTAHAQDAPEPGSGPATDETTTVETEGNETDMVELGAAPAQPGDPGFYGAILGDQFAGPIEGDERVIYAVGGISQPVWIRQPGFELRCDSVVIWGDKDQLLAALRERAPDSAAGADSILGPVIHAIYAEGAVWMKRDRQVMRGERIMLDFEKAQAFLVNAEMRGDASNENGRGISLSVRADIIRGTARDRYRAENAQFTTCAYEDPHYHFDTGYLELDFTEEFVAFDTGWWPTLRADTAISDDTPVLALPFLGGRTFDLKPLQSIGFGSSSRFGTTVEVLWGGDLNDEAGTKWADWRLHTDYRRERGAGVGLDVDFEGAGEKGSRDEAEVRSYYQRDTQRKDDYSDRPFDGELGGSSSVDRGRFHAWFREHGSDTSLLPEGWRMEGEIATYSDRGFLPEYFKEETLTAKQQETFVQLRKIWGNQGLSFLASTRLNDEAVALIRQPSDAYLTDYATQTQYLPSLTYHLVNAPILSKDATGIAPLGLSVQASLANVKRDWDDNIAHRLKSETGWSGENVTRGDLETRLSMPVSLGPVEITPSFGGSYMGASESNGYRASGPGEDRDDYADRYAGFWNLRVGTEIHRNFDVDNRLFSLHGLRHVASFDVQYFDRFAVSERQETFQTNDLIDELPEVRMASVRMRNRIQTHRDGEVIDWFDYEVRFLQLLDDFDGNPSALGYREDAPQPLQRLDFAGEDKYIGRESGATYHQHRARMQILPSVWLAGEADYDMDANYFETTMAGVRWQVDDELSLYTGRRAIHDDSRIWTFRADYRLTSKWTMSLYQQENTRNDTSFDTRLTLYRRMHDLTFALEFQSDRQLDETSFALAIYPNDWLGGQGDPLSKKRDLDYDAQRWYR